MPMDRRLYPPDWDAISYHVRFTRARGRCEGSPAYPDCRAEHGKPHPVTGARVVLTVAHLDHNPRNNQLSNLRAMCQRCHNTYDVEYRRRNRAAHRRERQMAAGQLSFMLDEMEV